MEAGGAKYQVLARQLRQQIESGQLPEGAKLYSENQLCEMHGISRQTVRQAISLLERDGYLRRRRGSGTYVCWQPQQTGRRSRTIGVISTYIDDYIFPSIIRGIEKVLSRKNYTMQLTFTHNQVENEMRALQSMMENRVDGIIVEPTKSGLPNPNLPLYKKIDEAGVPVLFFNAYYPGTKYPHVALDDRAAGRMATRHLIKAGHKNIAGMFQSDDRQGHLRYAGYLDALLEEGLALRAQRVLWFATEDIPTLLESPRRVLSRLDGCSAVVCYNDEIAARLIPYLAGQGLRVPRDISVIGIDNAGMADFCDPPLTSVNHPKEILGKVVAENLLRRIEEPSFDATVDFEAKVVERQSVLKI